jgi:SAM-dependent methyltransferase
VPFGVPELLEAVQGAKRVLDVGCGSGRLTVALAAAGADVVGVDTNARVLGDARDRAEAAGVALSLVEADMDEPLPFDDGSFDAVTSRLSLMIAADPVATLRELARVLSPGGRVATALWSTLPRNPWFDEPRSAVRAVAGEEAGTFARAFGKLGEVDEAAGVHADAGLVGVEGRLLEERVARADAAEHWRLLASENGHFRRIDAMLDTGMREAVVRELAGRLERYRAADVLLLPRTLVLVTARRPA